MRNDKLYQNTKIRFLPEHQSPCRPRKKQIKKLRERNKVRYKEANNKNETQKISLAGNDWKLMPSFSEPYTFAHLSNNVGVSIYNAMIAPLVPYSIRGALWYQGESNAGRAYQYRQTFPLMIEDWRKKWNDEFSFYFVQLATYGSNQNSNEGSNWAELISSTRI